MFMNVYECIWMCMNVYECICTCVYECIYMVYDCMCLYILAWILSVWISIVYIIMTAYIYEWIWMYMNVYECVWMYMDCTLQLSTCAEVFIICSNFVLLITEGINFACWVSACGIPILQGLHWCKVLFPADLQSYLFWRFL